VIVQLGKLSFSAQPASYHHQPAGIGDRYTLDRLQPLQFQRQR